MNSVEKEGMKLYEKLAKVDGSESERLQESMEDFGTHGVYISVRSLNTLTFLEINLSSHILNCLRTNNIFQGIVFRNM